MDRAAICARKQTAVGRNQAVSPARHRDRSKLFPTGCVEGNDPIVTSGEQRVSGQDQIVRTVGRCFPGVASGHFRRHRGQFRFDWLEFFFQLLTCRTARWFREFCELLLDGFPPRLELGLAFGQLDIPGPGKTRKLRADIQVSNLVCDKDLPGFGKRDEVVPAIDVKPAEFPTRTVVLAATADKLAGPGHDGEDSAPAGATKSAE